MKISFDRVGSGPTMVLLHPLGADRHVWDLVVQRLQAHFELISVDLPGFGESTPLHGDRDPAALAAAVGAWLESEGIESPHVVGNSLGGWVALELAFSRAARAVTAIAPAGLWGRPLLPKPGVARMLARAGLPLIRPMAASEAGRRLLLTGVVAHPERVPAAVAARLVHSYATASGFGAVNDAMRAGVFGRLAQVEVPVTLVWPEHDRLIMRPKRIPPSVHNVELPDAGHIPMIEAPDAVAKVLLEADEWARAADARAV